MEYTQMRPSNHNQRHNNHRTYPELVVSSPVSEQEAAYYAALRLVARIDEDLTKGIRHYRNKAGLLLTTLDQVIHAILNDDLLLPGEQKEAEVVWVAPQELAA
jgi:hypothetical protein